MGTHNYTTESYNGNVQILNNSISRINQTILPSDPISQFSMGYSVEVASFNSVLKDTCESINNAILSYTWNGADISSKDSDYAAKLGDSIGDIVTLTNTLNDMISVMSGANTGGQVLDFAQCNSTFIIIEANSKITEYLNYDENAKVYNYNWDNIGNLLQSDADELSEADYYILAEILSTMSSAEGKIDCDNLQKFIDLGYTNPKSISKYDYKKSWIYTAFNPSGNGRESIKYIQNKAQLSQTFVNTVYVYEKLTESKSTDGTYSIEMKNILDNIVKYFSNVEWRKRLYDSADFVFEGNIWSGGIYVINSEVLDSFNNDCKAHIAISLSENNSYYEISSNSYNQGNVVLTEDNGSMLRQLSKSEDGYTDYTIKYYIKCDESETSDIKKLESVSKKQLRCFYQNFDMEEKVANKIVDFAAGFIPNGSVLASLKNIAKSTTTLDATNSTLKALKSAEVEKTVSFYNEKTGNNVKSAEKVVDNGIAIATDILGILSEKNKVDLNNINVDNCITEIEKYEKEIELQENLGIRHKTLIIAENHVQYDDSHAYVNEVTADKSKAFSTDVIESDAVFDKELLSKQYAYVMYKFDSDYSQSDGFKSEVETLSTQIKEYLSTGKVVEGSLLDSYIKKMDINN